MLAVLLIGARVHAAPTQANPGASGATVRRGVVLVRGDGADRYRTVIENAVTVIVRQSGWEPPAFALTKAQTESVLKCVDTKQSAQCQPLRPTIGNIFVVTVALGQATNGAPLVTMTGKGISVEPLLVSVRQQHCEQCAPDRIGESAAELARLVLQDLAQRDGNTIVELETVPAGAEIVLDGQRVGVTNTKFATFPGLHLVRFEKDGFKAEVREFTAEEGKTAKITATLVPTHVGGETRKPASKLVPGLLLGSGAGLVITGAVLIYVGQRDGEDERYVYERATGLGVGAAIVGLGATGLGWYLLRRAGRSSAPVMVPAPGGAVVGWGGRF